MVAKFFPSINISRDIDKHIQYIPTPNALRIYKQIFADYARGTHSFSIIGSYGTGKSAFLLAFEHTLNGSQLHFDPPSGDFTKLTFEFLNIVGSYSSLANTLATHLGAKTEIEIWQALDEKLAQARQKQSFIVLVLDEFGKFLEYAAHTIPEKELYFVQQLAEYVNDPEKNILLLAVLHQSFYSYAVGLNQKQRYEWEKVKGRLKELTFNEPVEQLLVLAAKYIADQTTEQTPDTLDELVAFIEHSAALPHRKRMTVEFAAQLLPLDLLAASILTQALQVYGQNERSLFTFLHSEEYLGINQYDKATNPYYNVACVYDYLLQNYYSLLSTVHNPHYASWRAIRTAIERVEALLTDYVTEAVKMVKVIGLLNIFAPKGARIDGDFLSHYGQIALGLQEPQLILRKLEDQKIIRYVYYKNTYVLSEGTDLDIESALLDAANSIDQIHNIVPHLQRHFSFPYIMAKAASYKSGTPRFFEFKVTEHPVAVLPDGVTDGFINLIFSESLGIEYLLRHSREYLATVFCWFQNSGRIRANLFEIEKIDHVIHVNRDDRVAVRELNNLKQYQIDILNNAIYKDIYATDGDIVWIWNGQEISVPNPVELNSYLSIVCNTVYASIPIYQNELINRHTVSNAVATARQNFIRALIENWHKRDLGFSIDKFPAEKTVYLTLLKETGIHRQVDDEYSLEAPLDSSFIPLWEHCNSFIERSRLTPRSVSELIDSLQSSPFKLKQGFIEFWVPTFLFARRESFALYHEGKYLPNLSTEAFDLLRKDPQKFRIKAFSIDGVRLHFFNRYRALLSQISSSQITNSGFVETITPFMALYNNLPEYSKRTQRIEGATKRLREAIATAKDPEQAFFENFPRALGFQDVDRDDVTESEIEAYIVQLQESVKELQSCYDILVDRIEHQLMEVFDIEGTDFPKYKTNVRERFATLRTHLLLPKQRVILGRLTSALDDRVAWLNSVVQSVINRDIRNMQDEDELIFLDRLKAIVRELDNLCYVDARVGDSTDNPAALIEITTPTLGSIKWVHRIPKQKEVAISDLYNELHKHISSDRSVNLSALVQLLQEVLDNEQ
jgi:hypothetical protein